ncbi:TonB-dependent receptor plug domain-containing protein [Pseudobacteriovorax antillogorgiicola]|uniref:Outer membrane cobalamin receptor protein n=1 Tax=Pseudobacteriovorax antillogorgiicola TaxID=1513793 RepID=A0A1Y6BHX8_9BACT|nr:TonB-dependent receptor [Pseudobacteriovorax antillogorgiicola]TCS56470.1 outer membrane cobalamin receptor [Pseudobacteriovorax antillogorgiicola]SMF05093.1 Outer membrane cobalamin receptor protein [Pseudobacteriovorax antillogorgiicola]
MNRLQIGVLALGFINTGLAAFGATDETERMSVIGTRTRTLDRFTRSHYVINRDEIERQNAPSLVDYLAQIPGVHVTRVGVMGGNTSVSIRGSTNDHILVLIDGIPVSDQSQISGVLSLDHLGVHQVERIEVAKGPMGVAYGSDALAGAINIITRTQVDGGSLLGEVSNRSYKRLDLSYGINLNEEWSLLFAGHGIDDEAFSEAEEAEGNSEKDRYQRQAFYGRATWSQGPWVASLNVERADAEKDLDRYSFADELVRDDLNFVSDDQMKAVRLQGRYDGGTWYSSIKVSYHQVQREYRDEIDALFPFDGTSKFDGEGQFSELKFGRAFGATHVDAGVQLREEFTEVEERNESRSSLGYFLLTDTRLAENWLVQLGARQDQFDDFGDQATYSAEIVYENRKHMAFVRTGTSFKAPSLYRSYSSYGNPDLKAESGKAIEAGYMYQADQWLLRADTYRRNLTDEIDFSYITSSYSNIEGEGQYEGAEVYGAWQWRPDHEIGLWYASLRYDHDDSETLARQPKRSAGLSYGVTSGSHDVFLQGVWASERPDADGENLSSYTNGSLKYGYRWSSGLQTYLRGENILNQSIVHAEGYTPYPRRIFGGLAWQF